MQGGLQKAERSPGPSENGWEGWGRRAAAASGLNTHVGQGRPWPSEGACGLGSEVRPGAEGLHPWALGDQREKPPGSLGDSRRYLCVSLGSQLGLGEGRSFPDLPTQSHA